ncbi:MAG TPA: tetratricopeptide repeat protein [Nitrososphaeraceae archaeon]
MNNKLENNRVRNGISIFLAPILVLSLTTIVSTLTSLPSFLTVVYASQVEIMYPKDITWYDKALTVNQNNVPALVQKGTDLVNEDKAQQAIIWLDKALKIDPTNQMALLSEGRALKDLGQYQEAILMYNRVLAIDPSDLYAIGGKADSLYASGQHQLALALIGKELQIDPSYGKVLQIKEMVEHPTD